jgi:lysophospholipase L1-like esterase
VSLVSGTLCAQPRSMNVAIARAGTVLSAVLGVAAVRACHFAWSVRRAHRICDACAFEPGHVAPQATRRLLLAGDSTAVGIGASAPSETLVGRIAAHYPSTTVENHARMGARGADLTPQLQRAASPFYDAVLIAVGGNDILRGTPPEAFRAALDAAIRLACGLSPVVVVVNCPNVGAAPLFPWPLTAILSRRSLRFRAAFESVCAGHPVEFVNFTYEPRRDPFRRRRSVYFADDGLHPTSAAYRLCFERLQAETRLADVLG